MNEVRKVLSLYTWLAKIIVITLTKIFHSYSFRFTMLTNWDQIESILLPAIHTARKESSFARPVPKTYLKDCNNGREQDEKKEQLEKESSKNIYESPEAKMVYDAINFRLDQPIHKCTTTESTMNTLKYLFFHMKCGIFVMIRNGKLRIFAI